VSAKNAPRSYPEKIAGVQGSSLDSETGKETSRFFPTKVGTFAITQLCEAFYAQQVKEKRSNRTLNDDRWRLNKLAPTRQLSFHKEHKKSDRGDTLGRTAKEYAGASPLPGTISNVERPRPLRPYVALIWLVSILNEWAWYLNQWRSTRVRPL
jgi:hypothetical protein